MLVIPRLTRDPPRLSEGIAGQARNDRWFKGIASFLAMTRRIHRHCEGDSPKQSIYL